MTTPAAQSLAVEDLMTRGYFADRIIPPVNSASIAPALAEIGVYALQRAKESIKKVPGPGLRRSRSVMHSVPKRKHLRRSLGVPNPLTQYALSAEIAANWKSLSSFCASSTLSLSSPVPGTLRAVESAVALNKQPEYRAQRSIGARYLLKTDIARYYPSIYTHCIPWALHSKAQARADHKYALTGNRLDLWIREAQDKQTSGIPIGPDTSFIVGEVIGTALDLSLASKIPSLRGTRSIDDYHLYFNTLSEAERAIAALHETAREFELDINDSKTEIILLPEPLEPRWKRDLRALSIRDDAGPQATDLLTLFDLAYEYSKQFPSDSVLTYAAKQTLGANITADNWSFCESLLLKAALAEPTMLSVLTDIYAKFAAYHVDSSAVSTLICSICSYHAPLQQGNEVSWALWLAKRLGVVIPKVVGDKVVKLDDDVVALISLDLNQYGLFESSGFPRWRSHMRPADLYDNHWLIAYEACEHGWLTPQSSKDYIAEDEFFSILKHHGVRFYSGVTAPTSTYFEY
jgi:hypothetical protein